MKTTKLFNIVICSLLLVFILYSVPRPISHQANSSSIAILHNSSEPITIRNESDLVGMDLPGGGTQSNPFYIENLHIQAFNTSALSISEIENYYVVIRNCIFESVTGFQFVLNITHVLNLSIDNCSLRCNQAPAMNVTDCINLEITNSKIDGAGAMFWFCTNLELIKNEIGDLFSSSATYASIKSLALVFSVHMENCTSVRFVDNWIHNTPTHGLFVRYSNSINASGNIIESLASWSFYFSRSHDIAVYENAIYDTDWVPIRFYKSHNCEVINNDIQRSGEWGIYLVEVNQTKVIQNHIANSHFTAIAIENSSNCEILDNTIRDVESNGISIEDSNHQKIVNNSVITTMHNGIHVRYSSEIILSECFVKGSLYDGIVFDMITNGNISDCYIVECLREGIFFYQTNSSVIHKTWSVDNSFSGIRLILSNNISITNNSLCRNDEFGISLSETESSKICYNRIGLNHQRAFDDVGNNQWNCTDFGNLWYAFNGLNDSSTSILGSSKAYDFHAYRWSRTIPNITSISPSHIIKQDLEIFVFELESPNLEWYKIYVDSDETVSRWGPATTIRTTLNLSVGTHNITIWVINAFGETNSVSQIITIHPAETNINEEVIVSIILISSGIIQLVASSILVLEVKKMKE
ncbi:MAG: exported protein of unknown function [Candidatus Thorarchaeota archaeon]|nr:MAG: exported protein of unknown function [Candidatus Thorarchaeota archaeon]